MGCLKDLWHPFAASEGAVTTTITIDDALGDVWSRIDRVSQQIFRAAITGLEGCLDVHAGVVQRDAHAVLLPGSPGSGKTTLTLELLRRGWTYLSDDLAPLDLETGLIKVFPKPLSVKDPSRWVDYIGKWERASSLSVPHELFLIPPTLFMCRKSGTVAPTHVFFPERTGVASLNTVTPGQALYRLGELVSRGRMRPDALGSLSRLCREAQLAEVKYKESPEAADLIESVLGS